MIEPDNLYLGDCYELIKQIPDHSIDCIYTDIPYEFDEGGSRKASRVANSICSIKKELKDINIYDGLDLSILDDFVRVVKNINIFIWCSKRQIYPILKWFSENTDSVFQILVWCKTNPTPMCNGNWLPDLEYCLYFNRGTHLNDGYDLKHKFYLSQKNKADKDLYLHPTIKPLEMVKKHLLHTTDRGGLS